MYGAFGRNRSQRRAPTVSAGVLPRVVARPETRNARPNGIQASERFHAIAVCSRLPVYRIRTAIIANTKSDRAASETTMNPQPEAARGAPPAAESDSSSPGLEAPPFNGAERSRTAVGAW